MQHWLAARGRQPVDKVQTSQLTPGCMAGVIVMAVMAAVAVLAVMVGISVIAVIAGIAVIAITAVKAVMTVIVKQKANRNQSQNK